MNDAIFEHRKMSVVIGEIIGFITFSDDASQHDRLAFLDEIEMMKVVGQHPNLVSIIGCCTIGHRLLLVVEYCCHGNLQQYLRKLRTTDIVRNKMAYQMIVYDYFDKSIALE